MVRKMKRQILITNDDGIRAAGIMRLAQTAKKYGDVWVVAPGEQRSAASHSVTLHSPIDIYPCKDFKADGVNAYACSGTPADCVRIGSLNIMPSRPDVVLSGINYGYNVASDIQYSATVGAAFEASFQGLHGIALSEDACECHEVTDAYLDSVLEKLFDLPLGRDQIWNVNFPGCSLKACKGVLENMIVSDSVPFDDHYDVIKTLENGGNRYMVNGIYREEASEGTDFYAVIHNYVSVGKVTNIC